jgi:thiamine kinase-like enzyme
LLESIRQNDRALPEKVSQAAQWLAALHDASIPAEPHADEPRIVERCMLELVSEASSEAGRIERIGECLLKQLKERSRSTLVPSHGDYHPMNIFVSGDGAVTVIDFDTFSARERASDVAYFLSQSAIMGYLEHASFEISRELRTNFVRAYSETSGWSVDERRLGTYMTFAFLQSLHFERCILHTGNSAIIEPWLRSAERCLDGDFNL